MELLAPAGNIENFFAALDNGADAVYVGAPGMNARNLSRDLSLEEIGAMVEYCHKRDKKIYIAANSLLLEQELPTVIDTLAILDYLQPDALIVQDIGLINLIRRFFPRLTIHASTLMAAHNLPGVELLSRLGCERVVLARELTMDEISWIAARTDVELEVFVHGAMCFSYSGLCLFSSYLGGKSGLRGRCVQPCRRAYGSATQGRGPSGRKQPGKQLQQQGRGNYLFSMNDLDGLDILHDLKKAGVASFKIEGRLRSARYVEKVVQAYRLVLDANGENREEALEKGRILVEQAMSRKVSSGYFHSPQPAEAISPYHSGNMGLHLGRANTLAKMSGDYVRLQLKEPLAVGDRIRLHLEPSGERVAFTLKSMLLKGVSVERAASGQTVDLAISAEVAVQGVKRVELYKVDVAKKAGAPGKNTLKTGPVAQRIREAQKRMRRTVQDVKWKGVDAGHAIDQAAKISAPKGGGRRRPQGKKPGTKVKLPLEWWLKVDSVKPLINRLPVNPDRYVVTLDRRTVQEAGQLKRLLGKQTRNVTWSLPSIVLDRDLGKLKKNISLLIRSGFRCFQLGHLSQIDLFEDEKVFLTGDYSLNLMNNQALLMAAEAGFESVQLAMEMDREGYREAIQGYKQTGVPAAKRIGGPRGMKLGLTVYGTPPLFTSRVAPTFFPYDKKVVSPKNEGFVIRKVSGATKTHPVRPFSLLPYLHELRGMGLDFAVVDLTSAKSGKKELQELADRMSGAGRLAKLPTFNYLGKLE